MSAKGVEGVSRVALDFRLSRLSRAGGLEKLVLAGRMKDVMVGVLRGAMDLHDEHTKGASLRSCWCAIV